MDPASSCRAQAAAAAGGGESGRGGLGASAEADGIGPTHLCAEEARRGRPATPSPTAAWAGVPEPSNAAPCCRVCTVLQLPTLHTGPRENAALLEAVGLKWRRTTACEAEGGDLGPGRYLKLGYCISSRWAGARAASCLLARSPHA